jgi:hypothetical protein
MTSLKKSIAAYEAGLRAALGADLVEADLAEKHRKMRKSPFLFLRATCWRWAESAPDLCPSLWSAPRAPSVGDAHAGNFGLWRDAQMRLVWGINDYDEAAHIPWPLDLVRLVTSIALACPEMDVADTASEALEHYRKGLDAPSAYVLERDHLTLRDAFAASDDERAAFWKELAEAPVADAVPPLYATALRKALPEPDPDLHIARRAAGAGSLGRPRFVVSGEYRGGPVAFEAKAVLPSCWTDGRAPGLSEAMAHGRWRSPDPALHYAKDHTIRRLAPNSRKIDFEALDARKRSKLVSAMAAELAAVQAAEESVNAAIRADVAHRPASWLADAAKKVADWTHDEFQSYADGD